jgi:hypothetical protein
MNSLQLISYKFKYSVTGFKEFLDLLKNICLAFALCPMDSFNVKILFTRHKLTNSKMDIYTGISCCFMRFLFSLWHHKQNVLAF